MKILITGIRGSIRLRVCYDVQVKALRWIGSIHSTLILRGSLPIQLGRNMVCHHCPAALLEEESLNRYRYHLQRGRSA